MILKDLQPDKTWTLFLDRDGVINRHIPDDYVKNWEEFDFIAGIGGALHKLADVFGLIIVVTNQQGVGKGLYTEAELAAMHQKMVTQIEQWGGRIDAVYAAVKLVAEDVEGWRKPMTGMAMQAQKDFPQIDFSKSIMVGDSLSDMQFAKNAGMKSVWAGKSEKINEEVRALSDFYCRSLADFSAQLR